MIAPWLTAVAAVPAVLLAQCAPHPTTAQMDAAARAAVVAADGRSGINVYCDPYTSEADLATGCVTGYYAPGVGVAGVARWVVVVNQAGAVAAVHRTG